MEIRKATIKDLDLLVKLNELLLKHQHKINPNNVYTKERVEKSVSLIKTYLSKDYCTFYIVYEKEKPVAFMNLTYDKKSITPGYIQAIYVLEEYQRKGIGTELINKAKNELIKKNIRTISISADKANINSVSFYKKQGFKIIRKEKDLVRMNIIF